MKTTDVLADRFPRLSSLLTMSATRQLIRYAFAGLCVTQFAACAYSAAVLILHLNPLMANLCSTFCGLVAGYAVHSRWSFAAAAPAAESWQVGRFLIVSLIAFLINSLWVWLLTRALHLPPLAPVPLMMLATPWISFLLNRYWVFNATA